MAQIIIPPDPVPPARAYLSRFFPDVVGGVPPGWRWDRPLVVLRDGGGAGTRARVLFPTRLTVECSAPDRAVASELAGRVHGLLRAWEDYAEGVHWGATVGRPVFFPDDETGTPLYQLTVQLFMRGIVQDFPETVN